MKKNKQSKQNRAGSDNTLPNETQDTSPKIFQRPKLKIELNIFERELNEKQKQFLDIALDKNTKLIFVSGPAGTSKTYISIYAVLKLFNQKKISDLLYLRSAVESSDSKLGFLPGEANEKMAPYIQPLLEKLSELLPRGQVDILEKEQRIDSIPLGFLRGLNWNAKAIVADEAQNMTQKEIITLLTRTGEFSRVFVLGDPDQSDIGVKSGFTKVMNAFDDDESREQGIHVFRFTEEDIVRSGLVKYIIKKIKKMT